MLFDTILEIPLFTGTLFFIIGFFMMKNPPKKINSWYGYRSPSSMKSQARWDFAQNYASREMMNLGFFLAVTSLIGKFIDLDESSKVLVGLAMMLFTVILLFFKVENAIKNEFGKDE